MIKALQLRDGVKEQMTQMQQELAAVSTEIVTYSCESATFMMLLCVPYLPFYACFCVYNCLYSIGLLCLYKGFFLNKGTYCFINL